MTSNVVLTNSSASITVTIYTTSVENNRQKSILSIPNIRSTQLQGTQPTNPKLIDLNQKYENRYTVTGGVETSSDVDNLNILFDYGGTFNFAYNGTTYTVIADRLQVTERSADTNTGTNGSSAENEFRFEVSMSVLVGVNLGA